MIGMSAASWSGTLLQVVCAAFLVHLAVRTAQRPVTVPDRVTGPSWRRARPFGSYGLGLCWTLGNPVTLLSFAALGPGFAGAGLAEARSLPSFVLGVFLGSAGWWTA